jgi:hypothetical protein
MLETSNTSPAALMAREPSRPALVSIPEARRQLGGIGTTSFYEAVKAHRIKLVKLGTRSLVPMAEIDRVVADLTAAADDRAEAKTRAIALAEKSVTARRSRRTDL